jgi:hypothetical protein
MSVAVAQAADSKPLDPLPAATQPRHDYGLLHEQGLGLLVHDGFGVVRHRSQLRLAEAVQVQSKAPPFAFCWAKLE